MRDQMSFECVGKIPPQTLLLHPEVEQSTPFAVLEAVLV
jgi:hypothetical protein